ncbi:amidase signature domain-containing protein [Paraphysoderma sedebokerense]|nr:amidase signature domain-containing protein [Paraphysoderma sedebokerense]
MSLLFINPFGRFKANRVIAQKRKQRQDAIDALPDYLRSPDVPLPFSPSVIESILNATTTDLLKKLASGEWKAAVVTSVFIKQAVLAHLKTNCITEVLFADALKRAEILDQKLHENGPVGKLHGLPISLKDTFNVTGIDSTIGFTTKAFNPADKTSLLVDVLIQEGAIPLCKTNVPQTLLSFECDNPIFGRTTNPYSELYTAGGSSGGEGAILALKGAAIGLGSDIGGSLRFPAHFCGIYSLKPSIGRLSSLNTTSFVTGREGLITVMGPMARSIDDLELVTKIFIDRDLSKFDHDVVPLPWRPYEAPKKLRIGYYFDDGYLRSTPSCQRAVLETVEALKAAGHEVFPFHPPNVTEAMSIAYNLLAIDRFDGPRSVIGSDPIVPSLKLLLFVLSLPRIFTRFLAWITKKLGDSKSGLFFGAAYHHSVTELFDWTSRRNEYRKLFAQTWDQTAKGNTRTMDAIICPVNSMPAPPHDSFRWLSACASYSLTYNILDYSCGVIPVTTVNPQVDSYQASSSNLTVPGTNHELEATIIHKRMVAHYNADGMKGLPIGVQIVGRRFEEEKVLKIMKVVESCLKFYRGKSGPLSSQENVVTSEAEESESEQGLLSGRWKKKSPKKSSPTKKKTS